MNLETLRELHGDLGERRILDLFAADPERAAGRYQVFKEQTWDALQSLKEIYHYHFIITNRHHL